MIYFYKNTYIRHNYSELTNTTWQALQNRAEYFGARRHETPHATNVMKCPVKRPLQWTVSWLLNQKTLKASYLVQQHYLTRPSNGHPSNLFWGFQDTFSNRWTNWSLFPFGFSHAPAPFSLAFRWLTALKPKARLTSLKAAHAQDAQSAPSPKINAPHGTNG